MSDVPVMPPFWADGPPAVDRGHVTPSTDDVAALERNRIIDAGGNDRGLFDDSTRPTVTEVEALIDDAVDVVLAELPDHIDPILYGAVKRLVALRAAMSVEQSYFSPAGDTGTVEAWTARFALDLQALQAAVQKATWIA